LTKLSKREISKGIGRYLDELDAGALSVHLGPRRGLTRDPDEIDEYAEKIEAELAETTSSIKRLRLRQKVIDLRGVADALRQSTGPAFFVEHAADWADANGISYAAFRDLGVPADVLREAGIS
jgi:hypothetical protein